MSLRRLSSVLLFSAVTFLAPSPLTSQSREGAANETTRYEAFAGYSGYYPGGKVDAVAVPDFKTGWAAQFVLNCNSHVRLAIDLNGHYNSFGVAHDVALGPQFVYRMGRFAPFVEIMTGVQDFGPKKSPSQNSATYILGGGFDLKLTRRISIRPIQLDYINTYYNPNQQTVIPIVRSNLFQGFRDQAGLVFALALPQEPSLATAACDAKPASVEPGAPIAISVVASRFRQRHLTYTYTSTGGILTANEDSARMDTTGLAPGNYAVTAKVSDRRKHPEAAACQVAFTITAPPKLDPSLKVTPESASVVSGTPSTITVAGTSPDNHPLTYQCSASAGQLSGSGTTFTLDTAGVPAGKVSINCTATDDRNLTARASTSIAVNVSAPVPSALHFGAVQFKHDPARPTRVDNEAKGLLDRYGDALAASPDAKGVVIGYASAEEAAPQKSTPAPTQFAAQRAINTKDYLVTGKGIDPARIETRTVSDADQKAELWILSPGASIPDSNTKLVDESKIKAVPRTALPRKKASRAARHAKLHGRAKQAPAQHS